MILKEPELLSQLGGGELCDDVLAAAEQFTCHLYSNEVSSSINDVRLIMFVKGKKSHDSLPPTKDARKGLVRTSTCNCSASWQNDEDIRNDEDED